jgi:hypothetical protein
VAAATHAEKFVHVTSAGSSEGDADLNSPFIAAARFADVREMVDFNELSPEDSLALETAWADLQAAMPVATLALPNVLVVGSTDAQGNVSSFSAPGDVRAPGEEILGPCVSQDPAFSPGALCDGEMAIYSGSGMAAAQVSGLAAYMMNLRDVTPARVRQLILASQEASQTGIVDAYDAVLALDDADAQPVREALLDVAGFESDESDGRFSEYDLEVLANIDSGPIVLADEPGVSSFDPPDVVPESQRFDLNGDGIVGGTATARFDLDNDGTYSQVTQDIEGDDIPFDENAVTDFDIVCYNAYSDVYSGDLTLRAQYVVPGHSGLFVQIDGVPERVAAGDTATVTVTAGYNVAGGGVTYAEGIEIDQELDGVESEESGGSTAADGTFRTRLTFGDNSNVMTVGVWAETAEAEAYTETTAKRHNQVEIIDRYVSVVAEVFSVYNQDIGVPSATIIQEYVFHEVAHNGAVDTTLTAMESGSGAGMSVTGASTTDVSTRVDLGDGTDFYGMSITAETDASITLTDPNFGIRSYQADALSYVDVSVSFIVWGDPAPFNMHGDVDAREYDIDLDGPEGTVFLCDSSDEPCFTISTGGALEPGEYDLDVYVGDDGSIRWVDGCTDCTTSGTHGSTGSLHLNFEVNHNGQAATAASLTDASKPR